MVGMKAGFVCRRDEDHKPTVEQVVSGREVSKGPVNVAEILESWLPSEGATAAAVGWGETEIALRKALTGLLLGGGSGIFVWVGVGAESAIVVGEGPDTIEAAEVAKRGTSGVPPERCKRKVRVVGCLGKETRPQILLTNIPRRL